MTRAINRRGKVSLVGAGPGDPELLTLKALNRIQAADVILHDRLVSREILDLAPAKAKRVLVGKKGGGQQCRQDDIDAMIVRLARSGYTVVRLKGGDPGLFGRAAEELAACDRAGIPCEIVPGITAAVGAAAALRIPLTDRASAQRLQLITGHTRHGQAPEHIWAALADKSATTAVYMGTRTLAGMLPQILEAGADPATPAIAILSATCPDERVLTGVLRDLPDLISPEVGRDAPCLALFGEAMRSYTERQALLAAQDILARPNMLAGPDVIARPATQAEDEIVAARA